MFFIAYTFKGQVHKFLGPGKLLVTRPAGQVQYLNIFAPKSILQHVGNWKQLITAWEESHSHQNTTKLFEQPFNNIHVSFVLTPKHILVDFNNLATLSSFSLWVKFLICAAIS